MEEQIRKYLQAHSIDLMDKIDELKMRDATSDLVSLVERVKTVASISVLNLDSISESDFIRVRQAIQICDEMLEHEENIDQYFDTLDDILNALENDFRKNKLLLDEQNKHSRRL